MSDFLDAVEHYCEGIHVSSGPCPGCEDCGLGDVEDMEDPRYDDAFYPSFSWRQCESCGSTFGGDRHPAHYIDSDGEICHMDVCTDCYLFHANGDVPEEWWSSPQAYRAATEKDPPRGYGGIYGRA